MLIGNQIPVIPQDYLGAKGHFFVGGSVKGSPDKHYYAGQMYVEVYVPRKVLHPYPWNYVNFRKTKKARAGTPTRTISLSVSLPASKFSYI